MKMSDFNKSSACTSKTKEVLITKTASNRHFDEAIIIKDFFKDIISGQYEWSSKEDLKEEVAASYTDANIDEVEETQAAYVKKITGNIYRYFRSEHRKTIPGKRTIIIPDEPIILDLTKQVITDFDGAENIECRIDAIDNYSEKNILEGIIFKKGASKIGKTASAYKNVYNDIPLNLMRLALRQYADTFLQPGEKVSIIASYYYSAKQSDKSDSNYIDDYFGSDCPTRSISETYTKLPDGAVYGSEAYPFSDLDKEFFELLDKWATGYEKCDMDEEKDCKGCKDYWICHYAPAPKSVKEEKALKKREKCVLSDEQKEIVNAQEGIFICNAVPGSGKTETAIKQRTVSIILNELEDVKAKYLAGEDIKDLISVNAEFNTMDDGAYRVARDKRGTTRDGKLPSDWVE